jgi:ribosomal protein S27AE
MRSISFTAGNLLNVHADRVGPVATVLRGLRRRCGRCGEREIFDGHFRLREHCPRCGYAFKREEGFFTGVILVNFSATLVVLWLLIMAYVLWRAATDSHSSLAPMLVGCIAIGVVVPIAFYARAAATWAALDLVMRPLEPDEEADAALRIGARDADDS